MLLGAVASFFITYLLNCVIGWFEDRRYFPACKTGRCRARRHYRILKRIELEDIDRPDTYEKGPEIGIVFRCRCGVEYIHLLTNKRFMELSEGKRMPYLRLDEKDKWVADDATSH